MRCDRLHCHGEPVKIGAALRTEVRHWHFARYHFWLGARLVPVAPVERATIYRAAFFGGLLEDKFFRAELDRLEINYKKFRNA
jgi:hypothetical protein